MPTAPDLERQLLTVVVSTLSGAANCRINLRIASRGAAASKPVYSRPRFIAAPTFQGLTWKIPTICLRHPTSVRFLSMLLAGHDLNQNPFSGDSWQSRRMPLVVGSVTREARA